MRTSIGVVLLLALGVSSVKADVIVFDALDDPTAAPAAVEWFPQPPGPIDLGLIEPPVQLIKLNSDLTPIENNTLIPLPPAWTGLAALTSLAAVGWRRPLVRFFR